MKIDKNKILKTRSLIETTKSTNIYYQCNPGMFDIIVDEVFKHITVYSRVFASKRFKHVNEWIHQMLKFLDNDRYSFIDYGMNECVYLIFNGMQDFPECKICKKKLDNPTMFGNIFIGFNQTCSKECGELCRQQSYVATCIKSYGVPHYAQNKERYEQRCDKMKQKYGVRNVFELDSTKRAIKQTKKDNHGDENYTNIELIRKTRYEKYNGKWESEESSEKRRQSFIHHYGVDHNMKSEVGLQAYEDAIERKYGKGIRNISQVEEIKHKKACTCKKNFGVEYSLQSKDGQKKFQETCIDLYGVPYPMQNHEIFKKSRSKYVYDGKTFDSSPEIAFYIWLKDVGISFEYQPSPGLTYKVNGKTHVYFPDFKVGDIYFEIKGDYFFDSNGNLIDPFNTVNAQIVYEKWKCMMNNNVVVMKSSEYKMFELYVKQTYGCDYLKQFKKCK